MMDDEADEMKSTLTSTMDNIAQNVLLSENNDKNDANDSTPTSSTDAASRYSTTSVNATDDPISSTSSDVSEKRKVLSEDTMEIKSENIAVSKSLIGSDSDVDLLDITTSEPINEDVEDIVQDLENLLGESEPTKDYLSIRKKHVLNEDTVECGLTSLENLVNANEQTDEMTLELIQKKDTHTDFLNVVQISPEVFEEEEVMEKLNSKITDSKSQKEKNEKLQEQLKEQAQRIVLVFDNPGTVPNTEVSEDNEEKFELETQTNLVKEMDCEIKKSEEENDLRETFSEIEILEIETKDDDTTQINLINVSKLQGGEDVANKNEDNSVDNNLNSLDSFTEIGQSSQDPMIPSLKSDCIMQDTEIESVSKDQPSVNNQVISEMSVFSLVSKATADTDIFQKPSLDSVPGQSSEVCLQIDNSKSELQESLSSENILPETSYATTEQSVDFNEIVKSAVDDVIKGSTSSNESIKSAVDDVIEASTSSNEIIKSAVDDILKGSTSNDIVKSAVDDVIEVNNSCNEFVKSAVNDVIKGSISSYIIDKSRVDDVIEASTSSNEIVKSAVNDVIEGSTSSYVIVKSTVDDIIEASTSSDEIVKLAVDDVIEASTSSNEIVKSGTNYVNEGSTSSYVIMKSTGDDVIEANTSSNEIFKSVVDAAIEGNTSSIGILNSAADDVIVGSTACNEIVKSSVDNVIEVSASSSLLRKEFSDQLISLPEKKLDIIQEPVSGINILQDDKKLIKLSESENFITELTEEVEIVDGNSRSVMSDNVEETGDNISSSKTDKIGISKNVESILSDVEPISSNLLTATEELYIEASETFTEEPVVEKEVILENKTEFALKDSTETVTENKLSLEEINAQNESMTVLEHLPKIHTDKTEEYPEEEIKVVVEDKMENIVKTAIDGTVSVFDDEAKILKSENNVAAEIDSGFNVTEHCLENEPELCTENEGELVKDMTDTVNIECESIVEDQPAQDIENLSEISENAENESELMKDVSDTAMIIDCGSIVAGQLAQDVHKLSEPFVNAETVSNVEIEEVEYVRNETKGEIEQTEKNIQPSDFTLIVQERTKLFFKDKSELVIEGKLNTAESESQEIIKDNVEFEENETSSTTNDKSELMLPDASIVELNDKSEPLEEDTTVQIVEEVSVEETTNKIESSLVVPSNLEPEMTNMTVKIPDNSSCSLQQSHNTGEELKFDIKKIEVQYEEVAQINEISSASILEAAKSSEINLDANNREKTEESSENLKKVESTNAEVIDPGINKEEKDSVPTVEEMIVKKTIIYEHDCHHKSAYSYENEGVKRESTLDKYPEERETILSNHCGKYDETDIKMKDHNLINYSSSSKNVIESSLDSHDVESNLNKDEDNVQKLDLHEGNKNEKPQSVIMDTAANNLITNVIEVTEKKNFEEIDILDSREVVIKQSEENVQSLNVIEDTAVHNTESEISKLNKILDTSVYCDTSEKQVSMKQTDESGDKVSNPIHDQTTAAVQSILDNMLAEEQNVVLISDKEETPVVHSSYSSYELQKAVQQIQDISKMDENEDLSSEDVPYVADIEKPKEPVEIVQMIAESSQANVEEYQESFVQTIEAESTTVSIPEQNESIDAFEPESPADDLLENPQPSGSDNTSEEETDAAKLKNIHIRESDQDAVKTVSSSQSPGKHVELQSVLSNNKKIEIPFVEPSIDLSEESSNEECSESEHMHDKVSSTCISPEKFEMNLEEKVIEIPTVQSPSRAETVVEFVPVKSDVKKIFPRETRHSSRISERSKDKLHNTKENIIEPLTINVDEMEKEKNCSPKVAVKIKDDESTDDREEHKGSLKITITKQSDNTHSILKICSPDTELRHKIIDNDEMGVVPKLVIKTAETDLHSPKMSTRSSKQSLSANITQKSGSPRITIKPIPKPDNKDPITSPLKITIKPMGKPEEFSKQQQQKHSPKVSKSKLDDDHYGTRSKILKLSDNSEVVSHKVIIKPIVKPSEDCEQGSTPKITIKPFDKPDSESKVSPKITIKPLVRPVDLQSEIDEEIKERIVLKINKGTIPSKDIDKVNREPRKREHEDDKSEKLAKIKLKFSKGGDAHIVHEANVERRSLSNKRTHESEGFEKNKRNRCDNIDNNSDDDVKIVEDRQSPIVISEDSRSQDSVIVIEEGNDSPPGIVKTLVVPVPVTPMAHVPKKRGRPRKVPLVVREDFGNLSKEELQPVPSSTDVNQTPPLTQDTETSGRPKRSCRGQSVRDTLGMKPRKPKAPSKPRGAKRGSGLKTISMKVKQGPQVSVGKLELIKKSLTEEATESAKIVSISKIVSTGLLEKILDRPDPKLEKPIELKGLLEAAKDQNIIEIIEVDTPSSSPKHISIGTQDVLDINDKILVEDIENHSDNLSNIIEIQVSRNEVGSSRSNVDLVKDDADPNRILSELGVVDAVGSDVEMQPPTPVFAPPLIETSAMDISQSTDIAMFEEETRMSAEASSRAETPAKQVVSADVVVEESQSSVQSTATTESGKISRKSRLEVHQEVDGSVVTADQLNEYYWGGNGPFMIQEQVAQFLGIKSFKRKYPTIPRRMVDMQERDYIRENGLASESMCDLGLTAVNSADILDIMYSDFQERYEEFCKFQREKQAKDLLNKQKALSQAANHERNKLDLVEQAVHSAAAYNTNFNRARKEHRRACMDLQTMSVHYPKGKLRQISLPKMGNYPVAVVPGQYTDYYKEFTPTELNNLPINTMLYTELHKILPEVSDSDSDSSGSDSEDSSSSNSDSGSSCGDNCKLCNNHDKRTVASSRKSPIHASV